MAGASNGDFALARYTHTGSLDSGFGSGGKVTTDFDSGDDSAQGIAIQADGRIVVAGEGNGNFALARYQNGGMSALSTPASSFYYYLPLIFK